MGWLRDIGYYFTSKGARELYSCLIGVYLSLLLITHVVFMVAAMPPSEGQKSDYCNWQPEKGIAKIFWTIEYAPRKTTCWLWMKDKK